ncbi:hypothetical protein Aau02nite_71930 [Amorphoplanes auranticolor]|uniref:Uncharacterized protein n=1 Tax=Actinoplanes auranticolor TaxID=47988 RepID=A0A919SSG0_9ACTN|nr:hypothetical protein Aau02nite_71930 [Actinoplanes auranticolor]
MRTLAGLVVPATTGVLVAPTTAQPVPARSTRPAAGTVTIAIAGVNGKAGAADGAGRPARIGLRHVQTVQHGQHDPRFRGELLGPGWDTERRITQAADGTWSDPAFVRSTIASDPYYYAEELTVGVFDTYGAIVGWGTARCTLFDKSVPPAA